MRATIGMVILLCGLGWACDSKPSIKPEAAPRPAARPGPGPPVVENRRPEGEDVTAQVVRMNGPEFGRPPVQFRPGSVKPRPAPLAKATGHGFEVQFPSGATITTPTVHAGAVVVSGGFKSKELYAFEATTGKKLWALDLDDDGPSNAACEDGVCAFNTESCTLFALDIQTGKLRWSYWLGDPLTSAPSIAKGRVFSSYPANSSSDTKPKPAEASHVLAAFDLQGGKILWQVWLDSDVMSAPVAASDFVYVTTFAGTLLKLEQATGKVVYAVRARATSAPVVQFAKDGTEHLYYTRRGEADDEAKSAGANEMIVRRDKNAVAKFRAAEKRALYIDRTVQASSVHALKSSQQDAHNGFSAGAPASAKAASALAQVGVGSVSSMQGFQGSRLAHAKGKNVNTMGDEVIATDGESGKTLWSYKLRGDLAKEGGALGTAPISTEGGIIFGTLAGEVVRLDAKSGLPLATYAVKSQVRSQPVAVAGFIYVGTEDGRLVAIDTHDPSVTGWATWGADAQRSGAAH